MTSSHHFTRHPTRGRSLVCSWLALALLGCADPGSNPDGDDDVGDGDGDIHSLPDEDLALRCADTVAPPLERIGRTLGPIAIGPCGHVAYHADEDQGWMLEPDGTRHDFMHTPNRVVFAPSGDMVAYEDELGSLMLDDLIGGEPIHLSDNHPDFGFVPSFADPIRGAWLWTCDDGVLERHDTNASDFMALAVVCASVTASTGSPRLTFADQDGRVWLADVDFNNLVAGDDLDYVGHDGSKRDDSLWIDHDGEVVEHVAIEWQGDDDVDSEWPVELWTRVLDREGGVIFDEPGAMSLRQSPRRGAPVFVLQQGDVRRLDAGAPSSVASGLESAELAGSGELFFENLAEEVQAIELDTDMALTAVGQFTTPVELRPSAGAAMLGVEHHSETCIVDDQGECDRILLALRLWNRENGLDPRVLLSSSPWNLEATLDDGSMLVVGAPVVAEGPTYAGEQPPPRVLWLDREGAIQAELPAGNGHLAIRQTFELGEGRLLFEYQAESGVGGLMLAEADTAGFVSLAPDVDVALLQTWVDGRAERVVFVEETADGSTLWFGALPQ